MRTNYKKIFLRYLEKAMEKIKDQGTNLDLHEAIKRLEQASFLELQRLGYHFQKNDFYSPLNDCDFLTDNPDLWHERPPQAEINWNTKRQLEVAKKVGDFVEELQDVPEDSRSSKIEYCWNNPFWNNSDALVQYGIYRDVKPNKIVEIGCGFSSLLMQRAITKNNNDCHVTQIEPYPNPALFELFPKSWDHHQCPLQRAPFEVFESLEAGDVCFYDGSHCAKAGSDVNWFFFEVLPRLASGVIIHIHDIFMPDNYPEPWIFERGQTWNEQYLLQAFLMHNKSYEILMANRYLWKEHSKELDIFYKGIQPSYGCSFWMQKV